MQVLVIANTISSKMNVPGKVVRSTIDSKLLVPTAHSGALIINADDWGRDKENTDRICDCKLVGTVSSVSAMVYMEDSERAACIAREHDIDTGLHLNLTTPFSASNVPERLGEHHQRIMSYLRRSRLAQVVYHPGLVRSFKYVVASQLKEYQRIYGTATRRVDGHHHMHLCANVVLGGLLPSGTIARRNFSFQSGEKSFANRCYRKIIDRILARRHKLTDFFYSLAPINAPGRVEEIFALASRFYVEVETHPIDPKEYEFLMGEKILRRIGNLRIAERFPTL